MKESVRYLKEWQPFEKGRGIGETTIHAMNDTKEAFLLIVQRWPKVQAELFDFDPYNYHVIVTNREERDEGDNPSS